MCAWVGELRSQSKCSRASSHREVYWNACGSGHAPPWIQSQPQTPRSAPVPVGERSGRASSSKPSSRPSSSKRRLGGGCIPFGSANSHVVDAPEVGSWSGLAIGVGGAVGASAVSHGGGFADDTSREASVLDFDPPDLIARNAFRHIKEKAADRVEGSLHASMEVEERLLELRGAHQRMMLLLKELELERMDLQAHVQDLQLMRSHWRKEPQRRRAATAEEIDNKLAEEELAAAQDVQLADQHIGQVGRQVANLRRLCDATSSQLAEMRRSIRTERTFLAQCDASLSTFEHAQCR